MEDIKLLYWILAGLVPFIVLAIVQSKVKENYDFDKDFSAPSMGLTFFLSLIMGPFFFLFVFYGIYHEIRRKKLLRKK